MRGCEDRAGKCEVFRGEGLLFHIRLRDASYSLRHMTRNATVLSQLAWLLLEEAVGCGNPYE